MTKTNEPIAIIGSACHFAGGVTSPSKLWDLISNPRDVRKEISPSRFNKESYYHPNPSYHGRSNVRHAYLLENDPYAFDTEFFGVMPIEAKAMDPQQRLLMETVYEGLESAGLTIDGLRGSDTAVYVGAMRNDYAAHLMSDMDTIPMHAATGIEPCALSNRISYFFDWHGPSMSINTACSSSIVAVHLAVQSLRSSESQMALACGSNLCLGPNHFIMESKLKMQSPDGLSKMWDRDANGFARGEGISACVLKTLSAAIRDGDHIECVIRETGINQDGSTPGITMPSATAQESLIRNTYAKAGLDLSEPSERPQYFEAHGTGTQAGDPTEAEAIAKSIFGEQFNTKFVDEPLYVGSIKTVLGHTEGTAGLAALLKASLALQNGIIPPNMHLNNLSEKVAPFVQNLEVAKTPKPWPSLAPGHPRRASVNCFGIGGANAHAILESYEPSQQLLNGTSTLEPAAAPFTPFVFSAISRRSLRASVSAYVDFLEQNWSVNLRDLAYNLQKRRSALPYRIAVAANTVDSLIESLKAELTATKVEDFGVRVPAAPSGQRTRVLGIFTGQASQYARMGIELIENSATARKIVEELQRYLDNLPPDIRPDWSLVEELQAVADKSRVNQAPFACLNTAIQIMLTKLLRLAGITFDVVVGHSAGEIAAAYAAGYLTARDAICIAFLRFHPHTEKLNPGYKGAMIATELSEEDAQALCEDERFSGRVVVAAVNSESSVTISGDEDAIGELQVILDNEGRFNRRLRVEKAYHSHHMLHLAKPCVNAIRECGCRALEPEPNGCLWVSSVYHWPVTPDMDLSDRYWADNIVQPVKFYQALKVALETGEFGQVLEVGPHHTLKGPASQTIQNVTGETIPYLSLLERGKDSVISVASALGFLWCHASGPPIDLHGFEMAMNNDKSAMHIVKDLPSYQWNHTKSYRHESFMTKKRRTQEQLFNQLLGTMLPDSGRHRLSWRNVLRSSEIDWLHHHQVDGQIIFPGTGYICTALEAVRVMAGEQDVRLFEIKDFVIHQAMVFSADDEGNEVLSCLSDIKYPSNNHTWAHFTFSAGLKSNEMTLMAEGDVHIIFGEPSEAVLPRRSPTPSYMVSVETDTLYNFFLENLDMALPTPSSLSPEFSGSWERASAR